MSDRKLLELAAKAACIKLYWEPCLTNAGKIFRPHLEVNGTWGHGEWNPLEDDGDAFRLAAQLNATFKSSFGGGVYVSCQVNSFRSELFFEKGQDAEEAARRALVRAAAQVGAYILHQEEVEKDIAAKEAAKLVS